MERSELKQLYLLLEDLNDFFHQLENLKNSGDVERFVTRVYPELRKMYYETVWSWLPKDFQEELENR